MAKQAGQQRASSSDCNLAVNRTLTSNHVLPVWVGKIWLRRRMTSNPMNCSVGVSACNKRVHTRRPGRFRWSFAKLPESSSWWSASSNTVHVDVTRPEKSSTVEQHRPRSAADLRKSSSTCRRKITTQLNSTTSDNVLPVDFNSRANRIVLSFCCLHFPNHASNAICVSMLR